MFDVMQESLKVQRYAFVEASAGTGKTFAIEHLAVRLVLEGIPIGRILVMTFTKAAKTELVRRIHQRLSASLEACESGSLEVPYLASYSESRNEASRRLRASLQSFHEANITTIHGFCQSLLSKYAFEAELSLAFFEGQSKEGQLENIRNYLQGSLREEKISSFQLRIVMEKARKITTLIEKIADKPSPSVPPLDFKDLCSKLNEYLLAIGPLDKQKIAEDFLTLKTHYNKFNGCSGQAETIADWLNHGRAAPLEFEEFLKYECFYWDLVREENLNKIKAKKKEPIILHYPELPQALQERLSPLLEQAKDPAYILDTLVCGYQKYKAEFSDRMETHDDLLYAMQKAVEKPRFFDRVRREFDAAIIDEFQDTDSIQFDIFEKLFMRERPLKALYLVGDPKQSIYAFRKADLYSYLRARDHFTIEERAHLSVNYRSEKSLVGALNALFSWDGWMPLPKIKSSLTVAPVAASEKAAEDSLGEKEGDKRLGSLHFLLIESESSNRGGFPHADIYKNHLVPYLASEIFRLQEMALFTLSRIALLVKDRHQAESLMGALESLGIGSVFVRSESITDSPVFATILALLRTLHGPQDLYALKRFLMSPAVNMPPEEIAIAPLSEFMAFMHSLKECFRDKGLAACLQKSLELKISTGTFFEKLFSEGDATLYEDFQQIQELLLEETSRGERSLAQLLLFLEETRLKDTDEHKHLQRRVSETSNAVTVMTMHASKGLEFDVVFAVGLPIRSLQRDEMDPEEKDAEKMRLLYVAMTRAKRRLYVPLILDKKQGPVKPGFASPIELFCSRFANAAPLTAESMIEKLQHVRAQASVTWEILKEEAMPSEKQPLFEQITVPAPQNFSPFWPREEVVSFSSLFQKNKTKQHHEAVVHDQPLLPLGAETGNFVHELMEDVFRKGLHHPVAEDKILALIEEMTAGTPFEGHRDLLLQMIVPSLTLPLTPLQAGHAPFSLCDVPPSNIMPEMEFCYPYRLELRKGFIDLFFMHEGLYYLVDWKTNWLADYEEVKRNEAMEEHGYRLQAALYADALQRYVKLFDIRPFSECFGGAHYLFLRGGKWESFMPDLTKVLV